MYKCFSFILKGVFFLFNVIFIPSLSVVQTFETVFGILKIFSIITFRYSFCDEYKGWSRCMVKRLYTSRINSNCELNKEDSSFNELYDELIRINLKKCWKCGNKSNGDCFPCNDRHVDSLELLRKISDIVNPYHIEG